jgi:hypothetical protein
LNGLCFYLRGLRLITTRCMKPNRSNSRKYWRTTQSEFSAFKGSAQWLLALSPRSYLPPVYASHAARLYGVQAPRSPKIQEDAVTSSAHAHSKKLYILILIYIIYVWRSLSNSILIALSSSSPSLFILFSLLLWSFLYSSVCPSISFF